ncbi:MAG: DinB family protein [Gemmatimonadota bacterium]
MIAAQRSNLIARYAAGPALFRRTLAAVPAAAQQWRPDPGKWSVHEIVVHCADSECNAHMRIRFLVAEPMPVLMAYDQDTWASVLGYHALPLDTALATIDAVRANTVPLLNRLTDADWQKVGQHSESGAYGADSWLKSYGEHLEVHSRQIERNVAAWNAR